MEAQLPLVAEQTNGGGWSSTRSSICCWLGAIALIMNKIDRSFQAVIRVRCTHAPHPHSLSAHPRPITVLARCDHSQTSLLMQVGSPSRRSMRWTPGVQWNNLFNMQASVGLLFTGIHISNRRQTSILFLARFTSHNAEYDVHVPCGSLAWLL